MKAAVCDRYGPPEVLRIAEVEAPVPAHDEILVRIHASTVNSSDWYVRSGIPMSPSRSRSRSGSWWASDARGGGSSA